MLNISKDSFQTWHPFKKKLEKVYYLFASLPLTFFLVGYVVNRDKVIAPPTDGTIWIMILVEMVLFLYLYFRFKPKRSQFALLKQSKEKMVVYYTSVSRYALVFSLFGLFNVCLYIIVGFKFFAAMYCIHLLFTSLEMPSLHKMARLLRLSSTQVKEFYKGCNID